VYITVTVTINATIHDGILSSDLTQRTVGNLRALPHCDIALRVIAWAVDDVHGIGQGLPMAGAL